MKYSLVTGASGFIGNRLLNALCEAGIKVKALSRYDSVSGIDVKYPGGIVPLVGDFACPDSIHQVCDGVDTVFHLAGYAHAVNAMDELAAAIHRRVTVEGTAALLEEAIRAGVKRFIFVSSVKAIGEGGEDCVDETEATAPITEYGRAKLAAEQLVLGTGSGMHVCVLRLPLVYGPGMKGNLLQMMQSIDSGRFPSLPKVNNRRSMVHVDDVVQALRLAVESPRANGEIYLVTDGQIYSTNDIHMLICGALGKTPSRWTMPMGLLRATAVVGDTVGRIRGRPFSFNSTALDKLLGSAWYSSEKIKLHLGFTPTYTFETALPTIVKEHQRLSTRKWRGK